MQLTKTSVQPRKPLRPYIETLNPPSDLLPRGLGGSSSRSLALSCSISARIWPAGRRRGTACSRAACSLVAAGLRPNDGYTTVGRSNSTLRGAGAGLLGDQPPSSFFWWAACDGVQGYLAEPYLPPTCM
eukprot:354173-Chlamydomonas_euryale.AAC.6